MFYGNVQRFRKDFGILSIMHYVFLRYATYTENTIPVNITILPDVTLFTSVYQSSQGILIMHAARFTKTHETLGIL